MYDNSPRTYTRVHTHVNIYRIHIHAHTEYIYIPFILKNYNHFIHISGIVKNNLHEDLETCIIKYVDIRKFNIPKFAEIINFIPLPLVVHG